ncbi:uncharacterized protein LOC113225452 [Hyposmocoma kahamanoa]|uniref:uncharacterized protein LOC113225452 n=1 Tax=Hyposmocoma kahamanoa TaxID=1477025 RepID=UPI000E6D6849|nr:uncharacterized protein LOC113225452 [Hyposmocoma kahamanoa]
MTSSATAEQMKLLMDFMGDHLDLARNRLQRSIEGRILGKTLWADVTKLLNAVGGAVKTTKQWQKVWSDKKYLAKKAAALASRSDNATGGGPSNDQLTRQDHQILNIMGEGCGLPDTEAITDPFPRESNKAKSPHRISLERNDGEVESESDDSLQSFVPEPSDVRKPTVSASSSSTPLRKPSEGGNPTVRASISSTQRGRRRRLRLTRTQRPQALSEDVHTRIFRIEEEKKQELAAIRAQLEKLTDVVVSALKELRRINNNTRH